jgi:hypothetical protein
VVVLAVLYFQIMLYISSFVLLFATCVLFFSNESAGDVLTQLYSGPKCNGDAFTEIYVDDGCHSHWSDQEGSTATHTKR